MAYNSGYNPDALPAHAEPEQAAQMLSSYKPRSPHPPPRPPPTSQAQPYPQPSSYYENKPPQRAPIQPVQTQTYNRPFNDAYNSPHPAANYTGRRSSPNNQYGYGSSPPPTNYGFGPPPKEYHNRPPQSSRPPPTPAPSGGRIDEDASLFPLFKAVDKEGTGQLTEKELRNALVNGDFTSFDPHTVRMMIRMFDKDRSGTIGFAEFRNLWSFLASWRSLFDRFDTDHSGNISLPEYTNALFAFGYTLSAPFIQLLFRTYDKRGENAISFDLFVQSCISLKRMTDVFK
ncbi:MAG: hypothetical protein M1830_005286, partial [Pleopsidium flavum]